MKPIRANEFEDGQHYKIANKLKSEWNFIGTLYRCALSARTENLSLHAFEDLKTAQLQVTVSADIAFRLSDEVTLQEHDAFSTAIIKTVKPFIA